MKASQLALVLFGVVALAAAGKEEMKEHVKQIWEECKGKLSDAEGTAEKFKNKELPESPDVKDFLFCSLQYVTLLDDGGKLNEGTRDKITEAICNEKADVCDKVTSTMKECCAQGDGQPGPDKALAMAKCFKEKIPEEAPFP